ncbi:MAG: hypothetical protein OQK82_01720 [Candidatus Pacearchaeota archaeon]|nr:hypothetical protein [Candidatus Pacearchaeota archaeon]
MKKSLLLLIFICSVIFGVMGFVFFMHYGGNNCDQPPRGDCTCFCCNMFNLRGYEACSKFGFYLGVVVGVIVGVIIYRIKFME